VTLSWMILAGVPSGPKGNIICNRDILIIRVFLLMSKGIFPKIDLSFESSSISSIEAV
jgi:hypothetical protein